MPAYLRPRRGTASGSTDVLKEGEIFLDTAKSSNATTLSSWGQIYVGNNSANINTLKPFISLPENMVVNSGISSTGSDSDIANGKSLSTIISAIKNVLSGKADKTATVSTVTWDSTNKKLTKTINGTTTDVVTGATILGGLTKTQVTTALGYTPPTSDTNTTYTFAGGTNNGEITITPSSGSATTVKPKGLSDLAYIAKGSGSSKFLREDGTWQTVSADDTKVTQTASTTDANYEVLFSATADNTTRTEGAGKAATLRFNPNKGALMEGGSTVANATDAHAEGHNTTASGLYAHAEGDGTSASGNSAHAEGCQTYASANFYSHAEGERTTASGTASHAEGYKTYTNSSYAHAEGYQTTASGVRSHAEGSGTYAYGENSHAEGNSTTAYGNASHAEGSYTYAGSDHSHASGYDTKTNGSCQTVIGKWNDPVATDVFEIGWGTSGSARKNVFSVNWNGTAYAAGGFQLPIDPASTEIANFPSGTMWIQTT